MNNEIDKLKSILSTFDKSTEKFDEHDISAELKSNFKEITNIDNEIYFEIIAFDLYPFIKNGIDNSDTYYGPLASLRQSDGSIKEYPDINTISSKIIDYWTLRVNEVKNPILKSRYSDLIWDFKKKQQI